MFLRVTRCEFQLVFDWLFDRLGRQKGTLFAVQLRRRSFGQPAGVKWEMTYTLAISDLPLTTSDPPLDTLFCSSRLCPLF